MAGRLRLASLPENYTTWTASDLMKLGNLSIILSPRTLQSLDPKVTTCTSICYIDKRSETLSDAKFYFYGKLGRVVDPNTSNLNPDPGTDPVPDYAIVFERL